MFHPFCHSIPCPSWTDNTVKSGQFLSPSGLWGKWVRKIQKTSLEANSTIFVIVYILANYCSLSTCWLVLSGQFLNPKMGNKSKLKISKLRIIIHQPNDNLSVESKRSNKTKNFTNIKYQTFKGNMLSQIGIEEMTKFIQYAPSYLKYFEFIPLRVIWSRIGQ